MKVDMNRKPKCGMRKCIVLVISFLVFTLSFVPTKSMAAKIYKDVVTKHIVTMAEKPVLIPITVETRDSYSGTYTDSSNKRTFTKHNETVSFDSLNDSYLTNQLKVSIGYLQFSNPTQKCNHIKCSCSFINGNQTFALRHYCSSTRIVCTKGGSTYCKGGYLITGGANIVSKSVKFTDLAK